MIFMYISQCVCILCVWYQNISYKDVEKTKNLLKFTINILGENNVYMLLHALLLNLIAPLLYLVTEQLAYKIAAYCSSMTVHPTVGTLSGKSYDRYLPGVLDVPRNLRCISHRGTAGTSIKIRWNVLINFSYFFVVFVYNPFIWKINIVSPAVS